MQKSCSKCGKEFKCKADDLENCHCSRVKLNAWQTDYLKLRFSNCLCSNCLEEFSLFPEMEIVVAQREDLLEILELQKECYLTEGKLYNDLQIPPLIQSIASIQHEFDSGVFFLKGVVAGRIIGSVRAYYSEDTAYIGRLIVKGEFQNKKLGQQLMIHVESLMKKCSRYELFTGYKSVGNIYLYNKLGYTEFKRQRMNEKLTILFMQKLRKDV